MTSIRTVLGIALLLLGAAALAERAAVSTRASAQAAPIPLIDAIQQGLVQAEFVGTGGASGAVIRVQIARRVARDLALTVSSGMLLRNANPLEQDMTARQLLGESSGGRGYIPADVIELPDDDTHIYVLEAYCLEAELDNPSNGAVFTPDGFVGGDLLAVLDAVGQVPDAEGDLPVIQAAVWVLTDDITREKLAEIGYELSDADVALVGELLKAAGLEPAAYRLFHG